MEIKKIKPSLWWLSAIIPFFTALLVAIVLSVTALKNVFTPMIKIGSSAHSCVLEKAGTYYVYQEDIDYSLLESEIVIFNQYDQEVSFTYSKYNSTLDINGRTYILVGSFEITSPGTYYFPETIAPYSISSISVGYMVSSILALVGSILGFVFLIPITIGFFVVRAQNRRSVQMIRE